MSTEKNPLIREISLIYVINVLIRLFNDLCNKMLRIDGLVSQLQNYGLHY